ncbi:MAG: hypothetical protein KDA60_21425, partial [Planctomycetales bacterium]|nr:hypothetical protein [Planctomycetales bacterium]
GAVVLTLLVLIAVKLVARSSYLERRRLRAIVVEPIVESQVGNLEVLIVGAGRQGYESLIADEMEHVRRHWSDVTGHECPEGRQTPFLAFNRRADYWTYCGRQMWLAGLYSVGIGRQLMTCQEMADTFLTNPRALLTNLFTLYFSHAARGFHLSPQLQMMLTSRMWATHGIGTLPGVYDAVRRLRNVEGELSADELFAVSQPQFLEIALNMHTSGAYRRWVHFHDLAVTWATFLARDEAPESVRSGLQRLWSESGKKEPVADAFTRCVGVSPSALETEWREWIQSHEVRLPTLDPLVAPAYYGVVLPRIQDRLLDRFDRGIAIRAAGLSGGLETVPALIGVLEAEHDTQDQQFLEDVNWALESLTGCRPGMGSQAWREQWHALSLPANVVEATVDETTGAVKAEPIPAGNRAVGAVSGGDTASWGRESQPTDVALDRYLRRAQVARKVLLVGGILGVLVQVILGEYWAVSRTVPGWGDSWMASNLWYGPRLMGLLGNVFAIAMGLGGTRSAVRRVALWQFLTGFISFDLFASWFGLATFVVGRVRDPVAE